ncbi:MAG: hypothetical protein U5N86_07320 [Planctomycetota bacterium]|nr:hypothetical protein [Planctomycetota bacterium]
MLQKLAQLMPNLMGGSADLSPSNKSIINGSPSFLAGQYDGRNMHFGVREHAMASIMNGMVLSGLLRPYAATFLIFTDYMRNPMRLAALMGIPAVYVLTHDSIYVGEDGPTHQPVERVASLRADT